MNRHLPAVCARILLAAAVALAVLSCLGSAPARADVTERGSFATSFDIEVPRFHGIEPSISLTYDSSAGNGPVGVGWRLQAGSYIARAGRDGGPPRSPLTDVFVLDGVELVPCAPNCASGGTHETRRRDFTRIVRNATAGTWTRWRPDGVKLEYEQLGVQGPSIAGERYALKRVTDTHGNEVNYHHTCAAGDCYLSGIGYGYAPTECKDTPYGGQICEDPPYEGAHMHFYYEERSDPISYAAGDDLVTTTRRLKTVAVSMAGGLVRAYALRYDKSASTGSSLLASVQTYPGDATIGETGSEPGTVSAGPTAPQPATKLRTASIGGGAGSWSPATVDTGGELAIGPFPDNATHPAVFGGVQIAHGAGAVAVPDDDKQQLPSGLVHGDLDGDGRTDVIAWGWDQACSELNLQTVLARNPQAPAVKASRTMGSVGPYPWLSCQPRQSLSADLDGDGRDDLILQNQLGGLVLAMSHGDGTFSFSNPPKFAPGQRLGACATDDLDADERMDLVCLFDDAGAAFVGTIRLTAGGDPAVRVSDLASRGVTKIAQAELALGDTDADGTAEIMLASRACGGGCWKLDVGEARTGEVTAWPASMTPSGWTTHGEPAHEDWWQLSSGDVDGDGRADALLHGAGLVRVATSPKGAAGRLMPKPDPVAMSGRLLVGDDNGDGLGDLLTLEPARRALATGDGQFAAWTDTTGGPAQCDEEQAPAAPADVNADGRIDLLCTTPAPKAPKQLFSSKLEVREWISPNNTVDRPRQLAGDFTGDGRADVVYVHPRNPGYGVYLVAAKPEGGYARQPSGEPATVLPGVNASAARWMPMDVGSPAGPADGKLDLVLVDPHGIHTLLSTGSGWIPKSAPMPFDSPAVQHWRPAQHDGDGRVDLVNFARLEKGVRVEYLLSKGDGQWTAGSRDHFTKPKLGPPIVDALDVPDVRNFRAIELNGDRFGDYVYVQPGANTHLRVLVGNGDGTWEERVDVIPRATTRAEALDFQAIDYNGDGIGDLARVGANGCLTVTAFVSTGYRWKPHDAPLPACGPGAPDVGDTNNIRLLDVNADGRTDVVALSRVLDAANVSKTAVQLLLNRPQEEWSVVDDTLSHAFPDTWAYLAMDTDRDGREELVHVGADLATVRWNTSSDRLEDIDNGRGGGTHIEYESLAGARAYLPAGSLPTVVERVTVTDAGHEQPLEKVEWAYTGAEWSDRDRRLLGFAGVTSTQGDSVTASSYHLGDACGARLQIVSRQKTGGGTFGESEHGFSPAGAVAPFTCTVSKILERECADGSCATKTTELAHDAYGNLIGTEERGAKAGIRETRTDFRPNTADYIVDRPARQQTLALTGPPGTFGVFEPVASTEYHYDGNTSWDTKPGPRGELRRTRVWDSHTNTFAETSFDYDARGNRTKTTNPVGVYAVTNYDPQRALFPEQQCTVVGCTKQAWDERLGVVTATTDLNEKVTTLEHDAYGRQTRVRRPDGSTTRTLFLEAGRRIRTEVTDASEGDGVLWSEQLLDGLGRVYKTIQEGAGDGDIVTETQYDGASDRPAKTSSPHRASSPPVWTEHIYDAAHRPIATILADGNSAVTSYPAPGETLVRDPGGRGQKRYRDEFGRTVRVDELAKNAAETATTTYAYDALDRPEKVIDAEGNATTTTWDSLGRKIAETAPDRGTRRWTWRPDGTADSATDARGQTIRWDYDQAGRVIARHELDAQDETTRTSSWHWDRAPGTGKTQGASLGRIVRTEHNSPVASGSTDASYDARGRVSRSHQCVDDRCADLAFAFDPAGRLHTLAYPNTEGKLSFDSEHVVHDYDTAGRLRSVTREGDGFRYAQLDHNARGQLERLTHANGIIETFAYDERRHWLDQHVVGSAPTEGSKPPPVYRANYQHAADGRLSAAIERNPDTLEQHYGHDQFGRLSSVEASDPARSRSYHYDTIGRITWSSTAGDYTYGDPAHIHAATATDTGHRRTYDANGNLTRLTDPAGGITKAPGRNLAIDWTVGGLPERIDAAPNARSGATQFAYDADDQRVLKRDEHGATRFFDRYVEQDADGHFTNYYWAGNRQLARRDNDGKLTTVHQDRMGSTRLTTDSAANVLERFEYDPYGKLLGSTDSDERLWRGERRDHDSGLTYLNARYYDPELGQFTAADTIIPDLYRPQSLNRYSMAEGEPTDYDDPSGHMRMQVELRKEQQSQSPFAMMYFRSIQATCAWQGWCPIVAGPNDWIYKHKATNADSSSEQVKADSAKTMPERTANLGIGDLKCPLCEEGLPDDAKAAKSDDAPSAGSNKGPGQAEHTELVSKVLADRHEAETATALVSEVVGVLLDSPAISVARLMLNPNVLRGAMVDVGAMACLVPCVAGIDFSVGFGLTPAGPDDRVFGELFVFRTFGAAAAGLTPGPKDSGVPGPRVEGGGPYLALGALLTAGASLQLIRSDQVRTSEGYGGPAQTFAGGAGPLSASAWRNADGQWTMSAGPGLGFTLGVASYVTHTRTWSLWK